jgi:SAM-dependent methyltransferase
MSKVEDNAVKPVDMQPVDPSWVGLLDAKQSGWFLQDTSELFAGFAISEQDDVLDVGCGDGPTTLFCANRGAHVTFTDIDSESVAAVEAKVREQGKARGFEGIVCDSRPLHVPDSAFDRIVCREVLEHVDDPSEVMKELFRAGRPGALYLITVPGELGEQIQAHFAPKGYFSHPNHIRIFSREQFTRLVEQTGLTIDSYTANGFFWVFWMCMHWIIEANRTSTDPEAGPAATLDTIRPPFHENMHVWASLWHSLIQTPEGLEFKRQMDAVIPKNQVIVARKPG